MKYTSISQINISVYEYLNLPWITFTNSHSVLKNAKDLLELEKYLNNPLGLCGRKCNGQSMFFETAALVEFYLFKQILMQGPR